MVPFQRSRSSKSTVSANERQRRRTEAATEAESDGLAAYRSALKLLTGRPLTEKELAAKLRRLGFSDEAADMAVAKTVRLGYVNDADYARLWADTAMEHRRLGPARITAELIRKGISGETARNAARFALRETGEEDVVKDIIRRRFCRDGAVPGEGILRRVMMYCRRRGFSPESCLAAWRALCAEGAILNASRD